MPKSNLFYEKSLKLIHQKGFKAMTIRDLAKEMNCDVANIYNYTPSKGHLLEELLFEISRDFHQGIDQILTSELSPKLQINELIRLHVELSATRPLKAGLLLNEYRNLKEPSLSKFLGDRSLYEKKVARIVRAGVKAGEFRKLNIDVAMHMILGSLRWLHQYYLQHKKPLNVFDTQLELQQLILPGLLK